MIKVHATITGHSRIDFDKKQIRKVLRQQGAAVRKEARRLVSRRAISMPGQAPGRATGVLMRSIKVKVASGGFWAKVAPQKTSEMKEFYPAYLYYGTKRGLAKRENYMTTALDTRREAARAAIGDALRNALKPR
jgi:hypothetical protein